MDKSAASVYQVPLIRKKKRKRVVIGLLALAVLSCVVPMAILIPSKEIESMPPVVLRVDDIQDYAFREGQFFLLEESGENGIPLSLAVITGKFGEDTEIVQAVRHAVDSGSEATIHGWIHEDLSAFSCQQQASLLSHSKARLQKVLGFDSGILVPPMFKFNEDTILAMQKTGYDVISSSLHLTEPGLFSNVLSIPGTVNLSSYSENTSWEMKSVDSLQVEITESVRRYGFAVIVTHPQEFLMNGELNQANAESYRSLLRALKAGYTLTTLEALQDRIVNQEGK